MRDSTLPPEFPAVDIPPADFRESGAQLAEGAAEGGFWGDFFQTLFKWNARLWATIVALVIKLVVFIFVGVFRMISDSGHEAHESMNKLASTVFRNLLGLPSEVSAFDHPGDRGRRDEAAKTAADVLLQAIFGLAPGGVSGAIKPDDGPARNYLNQVIHLGIEGWMETMFFDALSLHLLEHAGDLKDILGKIIGLENITPMLLGPAISITSATPLEWKLNQIFRPKLLPAKNIQRLLTKGALDQTAARRELALQGFSDERIGALLDDVTPHLSLEDLDYLVTRGMMTEDEAIRELNRDGWTDERAALLLDLADSKRLDKYRAQFADQAVDHYVNRDIEPDQFFRILEASGLPERDREMLRRLAGVRRELRVKLLSTSDMEEMVVKGIQGRDDLRRLLRHQGYSDADALHLELLLIDKVKDEQEAAKRREEERRRQEAARIARDEERKKREEEARQRAELGGLNLAEEQDLVRRGIRSIDEYRTFLLKLKFQPTAADDLVELLAGEMADREERERRREELRAQAAIKHIDLAGEEKAVLRGILTIDDYARLLESRGFAPEDLALMVRLLQSDLARQAEEKARKEAAAEKAAAQRLSIAEWERAVRMGVRRLEDFSAELARRNFSLAERTLLVDGLTAELDADQAARKKRAEAEARAADKQLSLADQEKSFREGVITESQFMALLAGAGFSPDEQAQLLRLVELDIARDRAQADERKKAREKLARKQISLADLERAVMLGVVPVNAYQAELEREGFDPTSVEVLVLSLVARLQDAELARQAREDAKKRAAEKGLDLAAIESLYRRGLIMAVDFETRLLAAGFIPDAVSQLRRLVDSEIAQRKAEEARRKQIQTELRKKGLSLAQFEKAVKAELRSIAQYRAFLLGEGYSEADADLLVDLLENAIEAAAAKPARSMNPGV